jgi:hypothetical protein
MPAMTRGATWVVGSGVTHLPTIQAAVDVAARGDTVILNPGTYSGAGNRDVVVQGKAITIQGSLPDDPTVVEMTVIDCAGSLKEPHRAFIIVDCNGVVLSGLTITHGLSSAGGAVYCRSSMLEVADCRIIDNGALPGTAADRNGGPGGGLYGESSIVRVVRCLISGNTAGSGAPSKDGPAGAGGNGGGISCVRSALSVAWSTISGNAAGGGGDSGLGAAGAGGDGGGLYGNAVQIVNSTVSLNAAGAGGQGAQTGRGGRGGGICANAASVDLCILAGNRAGDEGKAGADAGNVRGARGGDGGGLYSSVLLEITSSLIAGNRAGRGYVPGVSGGVDHGNGGGLWCATGAVRLCTITENAVCRSAGDPDARVAPSAGRGGGIFMTPVVTLANSIVYKNAPGDLAGFDCKNIAYCNLRRTICPTEEGHEFEDPVFVRPGSWINPKEPTVAAEPGAPDTVWGQGDYHLGTASPWLDAGDPNYAAAADETDLDGNRRRAEAAVDLGAYESEALVPVYRFSAARTPDHLFTVREAQKDQLISQEAEVWTFEGPAFYACTRASEANLLPVYQLRSDTLGSHFYTIDEAEKDKLIRQDAGVWTLEGTAFYAYPEGRQPAGAKAVHRLRSDALGSYFYTMNEAERDKLIGQSSPVWLDEGIAWYAYETPGPQRSGPTGSVYELSGGSQEARCTLSLKAYLDGKEIQIDNPEVSYTPDHTYMRMTFDAAARTATLNEFLVETRVLEHAAAIAGSDSNRVPVPIVLSTSLLFWGRTMRGPFGIDSQTLTFPTTGSGPLPGGSETLTVGGSVTVDGNKLDVGLVQKATGFTTGDPGTFDAADLPDRLNAHMAGTLQWSRPQQDLLLETTVKGRVLQLYITSAHIQTTGVWQGRQFR